MQFAHRVLIKGIWSLKGTTGSVVSLAMFDLFSSTKQTTTTTNFLPLQSHAHCLVRLVSTVRWASVGKKAERGVEGTEGQRGGLQSLHRDNTHMRVIGQKQKTWATSQSKRLFA